MQRYFASPEEYSSGEQNVVSRLPSFADAMAREVFSCNSLGERPMFWPRWYPGFVGGVPLCRKV